jgi:hypothetical protein
VLPQFLYIFITVLAIIGNVLYVYSATSGTSTVYTSLWVFLTSPNSGSTDTRMWGWVNDQNIQCTYLKDLIKGGQAFAIITAVLSGMILLTSNFTLVLQQKLTIAVNAVIGATFSVLIFIASWIAFGIIMAIPRYSCNNFQVSDARGYQLGPGGFMYLGTGILSMVTLACHIASFSATRIARPKAVNNNNQQGEPVRDASPGVARHYQGGYAAQTPLPAVDSSGVRVEIQNRSPVRHELPLPEGNDWVLDESGLYWSDAKKLFFDRASGQFYDPSSDKWYNPEQNIWYKL